jgi:hypothetical protein
MVPKRCAIVVGALLVLGSAGSVASRQSADGQYLIETVGGTWEVREKGQKDRLMNSKYDVITTASQIRCTKAPCILQYSTDGVAKPLFAKAPALDRWIPVPQPTEPPVARAASEMQQLLGRAGVRGGADKDSATCGGDLPLLAPRCHETIDPADFTLRWTIRPADAGRVYTLLIGATDSSDRRRWNVINADAGAFQLKAVRDYLADLQLTDRATDVTLRLMRTENLDAVRLVRILSTADAAEHRRTLRGLDRLAELPRSLGYLDQYLKMGMWSKAAEVSGALLRSAPDSLEVRKYALIGFCGSDFTEETAKLRSALRDAGVTGICDARDAVR